MTVVLITGAKGFIGRNLVARLTPREDVRLLLFDLENDPADLDDWCSQADVIVHLAGVNRPPCEADFQAGNAEFTELVCDALRSKGRSPKIVMTSSVQATLDNPYGRSKLRAEQSLARFAREVGAPVSIHRFKNVFGKWCRPNYNSVTATFCHNIAHDLPITISDPSRSIDLVYIDDVVDALVDEIDHPRAAPAECYAPDSLPSYPITLGDLSGRIQAFHEMRQHLSTPDFSIRFNQCLYATFLTYRPVEALDYPLTTMADARGSLAEFLKSKHFGQIFVSRTLPGVVRGNHYHHTKTEKFLVLDGKALIRMRSIDETRVTEFRVSSAQWTVVDIPPGHTHSIENVGEAELVTLFWASELFDPDRPDTYYLKV